MQLKLDPASGSSLPARGGVVTQRILVNNTQHGAKPLAMRLRIAFTSAGGQQHVEQAEVTNFPPGL